LSPYGNSFDWIEQIKEKENSQGKITARECDDIIRKLSLKSFESEYKILIMWMPEELDKEGNKLLKIIEEPPPNTLFILVTENEELVLPTIVSRCQLIKIPALETKEIEEALIDRNKTAPAIARQVASVSEGNYREALQLVQHAEEDWQSLLREWLNAILKTGPGGTDQMGGGDQSVRDGKNKNNFCDILIICWNRPFITASWVKGIRLAKKRLDFAERLNKIAGIEQQQAIIEELDRASYYIERNAHRQNALSCPDH
jgi:DNA polymerase-3 subunit delta'